jgi:hypothetical protein
MSKKVLPRSHGVWWNLRLAHWLKCAGIQETILVHPVDLYWMRKGITTSQSWTYAQVGRKFHLGR